MAIFAIPTSLSRPIAQQVGRGTRWPRAAEQLIHRYTELFEGPAGRQLRCRNCLGLRYGEVKPPRHHAGAKALTKPPSDASADRPATNLRRGVTRRLPI